jgi:Tol biopolymer transport system component
LDNEATVEVIRGGKRETVVRFEATRVRGIAYSPTGHLLVSLVGPNGGVWAVPFSADHVAPTGKQFLVAAGAGACSASSDGSLVYITNIDYTPRQIVRVDHSGKIVGKIGDVVDGAAAPLLSPDQKTLAVSVANAESYLGVELLDVASGTSRRVTDSFIEDYPTAWSRDGRLLLVERSPTLNWNDPRFGIWLVPTSGSAQPRKLISGWWGSLTPDDRTVVFRTYTPRDLSNIASVPVTGGTATEIVKSPFPKSDAALSPDGRFLAYSTREAATDAIYVTRYPNSDERWQVSADNARHPVFSRDGHTIYFASANRLMSASFSTSPTVTVGRPSALFDATPLNISLRELASIKQFDIAADGTIIAVQDLPATKRQVVLVQHWLEEFR